MGRFGLVGPFYASQSINADAQDTLNLYLEVIESGQGKSPMALFSTPGLAVFAALTDSPVRGMLYLNFAPGLMFAVAGSTFFSVASDGSITQIATGLVNDGLPASLAAGAGNQVLIASGGTAYVYNTSTKAFSTLASNLFQVNGVNNGVAQVGYSDGFFLALVKNSNKWQASALLDATTWPGIQTALVSVFPDNVVSMIVDHREVILAGARASQVFYDSGNIFPFDAHPSGYVEAGSAATFGPCKLDNSIFWLGADERGDRIAFRANGYTPQRISNHAVENAWRQYSTVSDLISYTFTMNGHGFWHLYFPTAKKSWRYDVATGTWARVGFLELDGTISPHRSAFHQFAFNKHLVGDWNSGNIYEMSPAYLTDFGNPILRLRRSPIVSKENDFIYHAQLQVDAETGLGPDQPLLDGSGNPKSPTMWMRFSDDSGHTWSDQFPVNCGQEGLYKKRAVWRRLGRSRNRIYEISMSDAVPWRIIEGDLKATDGNGQPLFEGRERLTREFAKIS